MVRGAQGNNITLRIMLCEIEPEYETVEYDTENGDTQQVETVMELIETKMYKLFLFKEYKNKETYVVHEVNCRGEVKNLAISIEKNSYTAHYFHSLPQSDDDIGYATDDIRNSNNVCIHISIMDEDGNKVEYAFNPDYHWGYLRHSVDTAASNNSFTWILNTKKSSIKRTFETGEIIDIKNYVTLNFVSIY